MKFRVLSDIHNEFLTRKEILFKLPVMEDEKNTVLLLAGDIGVAKHPETYVPFMKEMSGRFKYVAHIAGNHEFYGSNFLYTRDLINTQYREAGISDNTRMHEREILEFDDVRVIMATLWTDMDGNNPVTKMIAHDYMNDYRQIFNVGGNDDSPLQFRLNVDNTVSDFYKSRDFIFDEIKNARDDGKKILVMTHHAPTRLSISEEFLSSEINGAFVSDLSNEILNIDYELTWIHGHVHQNHKYNLGKSTIICNPHGYQNENSYFDNKLVIEI